MYQLATEGAGFGPCGMGVPGADDNNGKTYLYDVDHRSNQCIASVHVQDISAITVAVVDQCPVYTGAQIASTAGGDVVGYDMYGQYIKETVAALGQSDTAFFSVVSAPADALWTNTFGLPYRHASGASAGDITYVAPANLNKRGAFTWGGSFPATVTHDYVVDRVNMFGDTRADFASPDRIADQTFAATLALATGAIAITTALIADSSTVVTYQFPDGSTVQAANEVGTVNHTLSPLYMSKYGGHLSDDEHIDEMIRAVSNAGTNVIVDVTAS